MLHNESLDSRNNPVCIIVLQTICFCSVKVSVVEQYNVVVLQGSIIDMLYVVEWYNMLVLQGSIINMLHVYRIIGYISADPFFSSNSDYLFFLLLHTYIICVSLRNISVIYVCIILLMMGIYRYK